MIRLLLVMSLSVLPVTACRGQQPEADPSTSTTPPPATDTTGATDGGAIALPAWRQHLLLREDERWAEALRIHFNALVVDGHVDTPMHLLDGYELGRRHRAFEAHIDLPRLFEGGLDAAFFSIYVPAALGEGAAAVRRARAMIAEVRRQVAAHADSVEMAFSAADVRRITRAGKKAVLLGLEGGHALAASPDTLAALYAAGIRYVTLTHVNTNAWADASQTPPRHGGLNELGRTMIRTMNRLGVLVDLSHTADATFYDALAVSEAPVILSHSSTRALTDVVRNASDDMLRALATHGGVILINFHEPSVNRHLTPEVMDEVYRRLGGRTGDLRGLWNTIAEVRRERGLPRATLDDVLAHIDHAVRVAGIDHVGLGSDFDGAPMPAGLDDVTRLPWITYGLLRRGYTETDLYKLLGGNVLRVLEAAETTARRMAASPE
ncbi:MAG: dipeptidase [Rhodothermaceae bacterium]|nr:MAG: dipeptidase [Rhodothermaceae bacterium]